MSAPKNPGGGRPSKAPAPIEVLAELRVALNARRASDALYRRVLDSALEAADNEPAEFWHHPARTINAWLTLFENRNIPERGARSLTGGSLAAGMLVDKGRRR
jgi:hypothetical protein